MSRTRSSGFTPRLLIALVMFLGMAQISTSAPHGLLGQLALPSTAAGLLLEGPPRPGLGPAPVFLAKWGVPCYVGDSGLDGCDGDFSLPDDVAVAASGDIFVSDYGNARIQKFDADGRFLAKWGEYCQVLTWGVGGCDGDFYAPSGLTLGASGNLYVVDSGNDRIQKFDGSNNFLARYGVAGTGDGEFEQPADVAVDAAGSIYVTDKGNQRVVNLDSNGNFLRTWGYGVNGGSAPETCVNLCQAGLPGASDGAFDGPSHLAVDASGDVLVADRNNHRVQKFNSTGGHLATWGSNGTGDGEFNSPSGIAVDRAGRVFVVEFIGNRVQILDGQGTFLAKWGSTGTGDGDFTNPGGIALGASGVVYVVDSGNHRIQKFGDLLEYFIATTFHGPPGADFSFSSTGIY